MRQKEAHQFCGVLLFILLTLPFAARAGKESGGGIGIIPEFIKLGREIGQILQSNNPAPNEVSVDAYLEVLESADIVLVDRAMLKTIVDGEEKMMEVDAINHPDVHRVELGRIRWLEYSRSQKMGLVFHELLALLKVDDTKYRISSRLRDEFNRQYTNYTRNPVPATEEFLAFKNHIASSAAEDPGLEEYVVEYYFLTHSSLNLEQTAGEFLKGACWGECGNYYEGTKELKVEDYRGDFAKGYLSGLKGTKTEKLLKKAIKSLNATNLKLVYFAFTDGDESQESGFLLFGDSDDSGVKPSWMIRFSEINTN